MDTCIMDNYHIVVVFTYYSFKKDGILFMKSHNR
jgi:hypothetical protein